MKIREVYLDEERYNPRIRATVPAAWVAVYENGCTVSICRDYEAASADEARKIAEAA